jgi:hypothetical protein
VREPDEQPAHQKDDGFDKSQRAVHVEIVADPPLDLDAARVTSNLTWPESRNDPDRSARRASNADTISL